MYFSSVSYTHLDVYKRQEVDAQAQAVFQNGDSLKGFLDFMAQCNTQKTPNLLLIYGQDVYKRQHLGHVHSVYSVDFAMNIST